MGFEPTNGGTTIRCLNHLATLAMPYLITVHYPNMVITENSTLHGGSL